MSLREDLMNGKAVPIIDVHGHLGPFHGGYLPEASLSDMVAGMGRHGVESIILAPHAALWGDTNEGNREMLNAVHAHPGLIYGYYTVNPNFAADYGHTADSCLDDPGIVGFKLHPDVHCCPVTDPAYKTAWERANSEKRMVLCHTWGRDGGCGAADMRIVAEKYPDVRLILGHSCCGAWREAIALACDFEHVYLELTSAAHVMGLVEWFCKTAGSEKVLFGTDYPWFDYGAYLGFVAFATISDREALDILYENGKRLLYEQLR